MRFLVTAAAGVIITAGMCFADPLPSWTGTKAKERIIAFVESVTDPASPDYVTQAARIAAFDNDGNLWAEQPVYFQLIYAIERLRERSGTDPSVLTSDALRAEDGNSENEP